MCNYKVYYNSSLLGLLLFNGELVSLAAVSSVEGDSVCCCLFFFFFLDSFRTPFLRIRRVTAFIYPCSSLPAKVSTCAVSMLCSIQNSVMASRSLWFYSSIVSHCHYIKHSILYIPRKQSKHLVLLDCLPNIN